MTWHFYLSAKMSCHLLHQFNINGQTLKSSRSCNICNRVMWVSEIYFHICGDGVVKMMMMWQVTWRLIGRCDKWHDLIRSKLKVKLIKIDVVATFEPFCNWWVLYLKLKIVILCWVNFTNTWVLNLNLKCFHICGDDVAGDVA